MAKALSCVERARGGYKLALCAPARDRVDSTHRVKAETALRETKPRAQQHNTTEYREKFSRDHKKLRKNDEDKLQKIIITKKKPKIIPQKPIISYLQRKTDNRKLQKNIRSILTR